jgi:hypothetical protein
MFLVGIGCASTALTACGQATPARPTNLVATATATNQIALTWADTATNETGFKIERSLDDVAWAQIGTVGSNVPAYAATGLAVAVKHYFRVRAFNGAGDSADSNTNAATTLAPLEAWRRAKFSAAQLTNPAISGPFADPDGDSLPNVSEFGWAREPLAAETAPALLAAVETNGALPLARLTLTHTRLDAASDLRFRAEVSGDLANWSGDSNALTGPHVTVETNGLVTEQFRDGTAFPAAVARFGRITTAWRGVSNTWLTGSNLPIALNEVGCAVLSNKLYVVGGNSSNTVVFDFMTGRWTNGATLARRPFPGNHHAVEAFGGRLFVLGGLGSNSSGRVQIYHPGSNVWTLGANLPWNGGSCSSALIGDQIYVAGGSVNNTATNRLARYDPALNTWTELAPMPHGRHHAAGDTDGQRFYVFGGRINTLQGFDDVQIYDPAANTWTNSGAGSTIAPLPFPRSGMGRAVFYRGEFYIMGGETLAGDPNATPRRVFSRVDIYDPASNTFRPGTPMPTPRHGIYPVLFDGLIHVAAGGTVFGGGATGQSTVFETYVPD